MHQLQHCARPLFLRSGARVRPDTGCRLISAGRTPAHRCASLRAPPFARACAARRVVNVQPQIGTEEGHVVIQTGGVNVNVTDTISGAAATKVLPPPPSPAVPCCPPPSWSLFCAWQTPSAPRVNTARQQPFYGWRHLARTHTSFSSCEMEGGIEKAPETRRRISDIMSEASEARLRGKARRRAPCEGMEGAPLRCSPPYMPTCCRPVPLAAFCEPGCQTRRGRRENRSRAAPRRECVWPPGGCLLLAPVTHIRRCHRPRRCVLLAPMLEAVPPRLCNAVMLPRRCTDAAGATPLPSVTCGVLMRMRGPNVFRSCMIDLPLQRAWRTCWWS